MKKAIVFLVVLLSASLGFAQHTFRNLEEVIAFSESSNLDLVIANIRSTQAKKLESTSKLGIVDPVISLPGSFTHNTNLPVTLLPAEIFGGEPGTNVELRTGVPFTTNFSQTLDVKLVNPGGWLDYKLARISSDITTANGELSRKMLHENLADTYYTIVSLNKQLASTQENLTSADSVYRVTRNKYTSGQVSQQDLNNAEVNRLNTEKSRQQIGYLLEDAYLTLKLLCNIPEGESVTVDELPTDLTQQTLPAVEISQLTLRTELLNQEYALKSYQRSKSTLLPSLSGYAGNSFQLNNQEFQPFTGDWINSNYVGLRLNFNLPTSNSLASVQRTKFEYEIASKEVEKVEMTASIEAQRLRNGYDEAFDELELAARIRDLNADSYRKNLNLYQAGLLGVETLLNSYEAMVNATYAANSAEIALQLAHAKILINNEFD
ncbi:MAG: TolC family protein [Bacteroidota bacterium]